MIPVIILQLLGCLQRTLCYPALQQAWTMIATFKCPPSSTQQTSAECGWSAPEHCRFGAFMSLQSCVQGQDSPRVVDISPEPVAHLSQHRLVPMLLRCATSNALGSRVDFDQTVTHVSQTGDSVTVSTRTSQVCTHLTDNRPG